MAALKIQSDQNLHIAVEQSGKPLRVLECSFDIQCFKSHVWQFIERPTPAVCAVGILTFPDGRAEFTSLPIAKGLVLALGLNRVSVMFSPIRKVLSVLPE